MAQRGIVFDVESILRLITHYTDGKGMPLDAEIVAVGFLPALQQWIGLDVASSEWQTEKPLHVRYEGKKVLVWTQGSGKDCPPIWTDAPEGPKG